MPKYSLNVNGEIRNVEAHAATPLLWILRDHLRLVGAKYGCGIGQCGSCIVHVDEEPVNSCLLAVSLVGNRSITTIEGLSEDGSHPVQEAWKELDVPQCGYCQAGQIMTAAAFLVKNPNPGREQIRDAMHGNLCRCAAYNRIEKAVAKAAESMR